MLEVPYRDPWPWSAFGSPYSPLQLGQVDPCPSRPWWWLLLAAGAGVAVGYAVRGKKKKGARRGG